MPFLIRIILQRAFALILSFLAFLGFSPELHVPTDSEIQKTNAYRDQLVETILTKNNPETEEEKYISEIIDEAAKSLNDQKEEAKKTIEKTVETAKPQNDTVKEAAQKIFQAAIPAATPQIETPQISIEEKSSDIFNLKNVVVNIICTHKKNNVITANTGSGVIVSEDGAVITNAHVGIFFLLQGDKDINMDCSLYRENIPTYGFKADLLYISPDWVKKNSAIVNTASPRGNGENDYAFLVITKNTNPSLSIPQSFEHATPDQGKEYKEKESVTVAGYPGAPTSILDLAKSVGFKFDDTFINEIFTFGQTSADVFSTGVTKVAAKGASGGGAFDEDGLIGLIATTSSTPSGLKINAITTTYINKDLKKDYGMSISELINGSLASKSKTFKNNYANDLAEIFKAEF